MPSKKVKKKSFKNMINIYRQMRRINIHYKMFIAVIQRFGFKRKIHFYF